MPRPPVRDGDEQDVHSRARHIIARYRHAGVAAAIKRRTRRRERHQAKAATREENP